MTHSTPGVAAILQTRGPLWKVDAELLKVTNAAAFVATNVTVLIVSVLLLDTPSTVIVPLVSQIRPP